MTATTIDAEKLKTIRKARKLGRPKLAKLSGVTERQIARLEGAAPMREAVSVATIERISVALQVPAGTLTGALQIIDSDLEPVSKAGGGCSCCG